MAFKEVSGSNSNIKSYWPKKASERKEGDEVIGVYTGTRQQTYPDGSEKTLYLLEGKDGVTAVNPSATITRAMEQIPKGSTVKIVFKGKARSTRTGREYNNFQVFIDEDEPAKDESVDLEDLDNFLG